MGRFSRTGSQFPRCVFAEKRPTCKFETTRNNCIIGDAVESLGASPMTTCAILILTMLAVDPVLTPAPRSPIPASVGALAAADVNGDGCSDLLSSEDSALRIYFGGRERTWSNEPDRKISIGGRASELVVGDFNRDNLPDLALADHDTYDVRVLLGDGGGGFQTAKGSPFTARVGDHPHTHGLAAADVDRGWETGPCDRQQ